MTRKELERQTTENLIATVKRHRAALKAVEEAKRVLADAEHEARQVAHYLDLEARQLEALRPQPHQGAPRCLRS